MYKVHKFNEYITTEDCYLVKNVMLNNQNRLTQSNDSLEDAEETETILIEKAKAEAERIISKARQEADAIREETRKSAYEEGYREGKKQGHEEINSSLVQAKEVLDEMLCEKNSLMTDLEPEIIDLSIKLAEKIIGDQLNFDENIYRSFIANAISKTIGSEITIYIHPMQYEKVNEFKQTLWSYVGQIKSLNIVKKETLKEWDCLIETENGTVDASVASQIKKIHQAFELKESYA